MNHALAAAGARGHGAVILLGDAPYYARFGFSALKTAELSLPGPFERDRLLGLELREGALDGAWGMIAPTGIPALKAREFAVRAIIPQALSAFAQLKAEQAIAFKGPGGCDTSPVLSRRNQTGRNQAASPSRIARVVAARPGGAPARGNSSARLRRDFQRARWVDRERPSTSARARYGR